MKIFNHDEIKCDDIHVKFITTTRQENISIKLNINNTPIMVYSPYLLAPFGLNDNNSVSLLLSDIDKEVLSFNKFLNKLDKYIRKNINKFTDRVGYNLKKFKYKSTFYKNSNKKYLITYLQSKNNIIYSYIFSDKKKLVTENEIVPYSHCKCILTFNILINTKRQNIYLSWKIIQCKLYPDIINIEKCIIDEQIIPETHMNIPPPPPPPPPSHLTHSILNNNKNNLRDQINKNKSNIKDKPINSSNSTAFVINVDELIAIKNKLSKIN